MTSITKLPDNIRNYISPHRQNKENKATFSPLTKLGIIAKLEYNNCNIEGKIVINDNNKKIVKYVKCCTPNGTLIYVDIETTDFEIGEEEVNYVMYKIDKNYIPHSKKHGDFSLCYPEVDGVVFEHEDCFVVITPDDNLNPVEKTYSLKTNIDISKTELSRPKSYPLVKITNLCSNPLSIFGNSSLAFSRLVTMENRACKNDISNSRRNINKLQLMIKDIDEKFNSTINGFSRDNQKMDRCLDFNMEKLSIARSRGDEKSRTIIMDRIERIRYNLTIRKDYLKSLFNIMSVLEIMNERLEPLVENISILQKQINIYYQYVGYEEEIS